MKKSTILFLMLMPGLISVAQPSKQKKKKVQSKEIVSVSLRHGACFGRCPVYKIDVNKNGIATYTGMMFVPDSGVYTKNIGKKAAMEIIGTFTTCRIDTFRDKYENQIQDLPGAELTIDYGTRVKSIYNALLGPPLLARLRSKIDSIIQRKTDETGLLPLDKSWHKVTGEHK